MVILKSSFRWTFFEVLWRFFGRQRLICFLEALAVFLEFNEYDKKYHCFKFKYGDK